MTGAARVTRWLLDPAFRLPPRAIAADRAIRATPATPATPAIPAHPSI